MYIIVLFKRHVLYAFTFNITINRFTYTERQGRVGKYLLGYLPVDEIAEQEHRAILCVVQELRYFVAQTAEKLPPKVPFQGDDAQSKLKAYAPGYLANSDLR